VISFQSGRVNFLRFRILQVVFTKAKASNLILDKISFIFSESASFSKSNHSNIALNSDVLF
jgi:hypothetical protein